MKRLIVLALILVLAACGGNDSGGSGNDKPTEVPPTAFPTFAFTQPTEAPAVMTAAARSATENASSSSELDPVAVERGQGRYEALNCAECHGEAGAGGTDEGTALIGYTASEADFIDFMRTGGDMGNDHRFPAEVLSNSGIVNLYQYLLSLSESE